MGETKIKKRYAVGIDAGLHTGVAIYDRKEKKIIYQGCANFWSIYFLVVNFQRPEETLIVIETPKKHFIYPQKYGHKNQLSRERVAFNAGMNNRESSLLVEGFERAGFEVVTQTPETAKWSKEDLKRYTGITERTNEHVRDAIKLVWQI